MNKVNIDSMTKMFHFLYGDDIDVPAKCRYCGEDICKHDDSGMSKHYDLKEKPHNYITFACGTMWRTGIWGGDSEWSRPSKDCWKRCEHKIKKLLEVQE